MKISKSKLVKSAISILLVVMMLLSAGMSSIIAATVDMVSESANVELAETGANSIVSDGSYRLYFQFKNDSTWWNDSGCYHYAWVEGTNMTSQWRKIYKVGTTSNASTGNSNDVFYMTIPEGTLTKMKLVRGQAENNPTEGNTSYGNPSIYNSTKDLTISESIGTYNLITGVTENESAFTHKSRYVTVSSTNDTAVVSNAISGSGTSNDPYIVTPGQSMSVTASCTRPDDHNFKMRYGYNSSSTYSDSTTGTVTADSSGTDTKSFDVYYTPCLNGTTDSEYLGEQSSVPVYYKLQEKYNVSLSEATGGSATGAGPYDYGEEVTLTATADPGYVFTSWEISGATLSSGYSLTDAEIKFKITANVSATPKFAKVGDASSYYLRGEFGNVFKDWNTGKNMTYTAKANVVSCTLENLSANTYYFKITDGTNWYANTTEIKDTCKDLDCSTDPGYGNNCKLVASGGTYTFAFNTKDKTLTVTKATQTSTVTVTANPSEYGTVSGGNTYDYGSEVTLTATAKPGYYFTGWTGLPEGATLSGNTATFTVKGNVDATANFAPATGTVTATTKGNGTVTPTAKTPVTFPGTVEITATPNTGYHFTNWQITGGESNTDYKFENGTKFDSQTAQIQVLTNGKDIKAGAVFEINEYTVTFKDRETTVDKKVKHNEKASISDPSYTGHTFKGWKIDGDISGKTYTSAQINDTAVTADITYIAVWDTSIYSVTLNKPTNGKVQIGGSDVTWDGATKVVSVTYPGEVTFTASPDDRYSFDAWEITGEYEDKATLDRKSTTLTIKPLSDVTVTAKFKTGRYLTIHSFSEDNKNTLYFYQDGVKLNGDWPGNPQTNDATINNVSWLKSSEFTLSDTTIDKIEAILTRKPKATDTGYIATQSRTFDLKDTLYNDGTWKGIEEVWLYEAGDGNVFVTTRRGLIDLVDVCTPIYGTGTNTKYTSTSWNAFKTAYEAALEGYVAHKTTQDQITELENNLRTAYNGLETETSFDVSLNEVGSTGTVTLDENSLVPGEPHSLHQNSTSTLKIVAPNGYYISNVTKNGSLFYNAGSDRLTSKEFTISKIDSDLKFTVTYVKRQTVTVTFTPNTQNMGNYAYSYNGAASTTVTSQSAINVLEGYNLVLTAAPQNGFSVAAWIINGDKIVTNSNRYTVANVTTNCTVAVEFRVQTTTDVSIYADPVGRGSVSATQNGTAISGNPFTVDTNSTFTVTATAKNGFVFDKWTFVGACTSTPNPENPNAIDVTPTNGTLTVIANFKRNNVVYLKNSANWDGTVKAYFFDNNGAVGGAWPGKAMTLVDGTTNLYMIKVPAGATKVIFNNKKDNSDSQTSDLDIHNGATYDNKGNEWIDIDGSSDGFYIKVGDVSNPFIEHYDGTYTFEYNVTSTTDGYIYVSFYDKKGNTETTYGVNTDDPVKSPQKLTPDVEKSLKILIDTNDKNKDYVVKFTYNPQTQELSWTKSEVINVIVTNGMDINPNDNQHTYIGNSSLNIDTTDYHGAGVQGTVSIGTAITVTTQINTGCFDYEVVGWVVHTGDKAPTFINANNMGDGKYVGYGSFDAKTNLVPVYQHTKAWLDTNKVDTVRVYAVPDFTITGWGNYLAAYTWGLTNKQFGKYPGQLMIPSSDGTFYIDVEINNPTTSDTKPIDVKGITFTNYSNKNSHWTPWVNEANNGYNNQTYDYKEFVTLLNAGKKVITFVVKNTNTKRNDTDENTSKAVVYENNKPNSYWNFVTLKNRHNRDLDIFGNDITANFANLSDANALYVIRSGNHVEGISQWLVKCFLYNSSNEKIDECYSYELKDPNSEIMKALSAYKGQKVYVSYESRTSVRSQDGTYRVDGEWFGDDSLQTPIDFNVIVGLKKEGDVSFNDFTLAGSNIALEYGSATLNGEASGTVRLTDTVKLEATPASGYKFVGWYYVDTNGTVNTISSSANYSFKISSGGTYYAIFEKLKNGSFIVNHDQYVGGTSNIYVPRPNNGTGDLYVKIEKYDSNGNLKGSTEMLPSSADIVAEEGDVLIITIMTKPHGDNRFNAWYSKVLDANENITFEEVGVDSLDNLASNDPDSPYKNNGSVYGSNDTVYYRFKYVVTKDSSFNLTIFSDIVPINLDRTITYQYIDRYGNTKEYFVTIKLSDEEYKGFAGNNNMAGTPTTEKVLKNAPYVLDFFKQAEWDTSISTNWDPYTLVLMAVQKPYEYTVNAQVGGEIRTYKGAYNDIVSLNALTINPAVSPNGFWYIENGTNTQYDKDTDIILCYGYYYGYRLTSDIKNLIYQVSTDTRDFGVVLDAPVYGRVQSNNENGGNVTDKTYIDYTVSFVVPFLYGEDGYKEKPVYDGQVVDANWSGSPLTIESLKNHGYTINFGIITEQVCSILPDGIENFATAEETAKKTYGYGTKTDDNTLNIVLNTFATNSGKSFMHSNNKYYSKYDTTGEFITNKNRQLFTLVMSNTSQANLKRFSNVYAYMTVTKDGVTTTYFSNVQTLNIYETALKDYNVEMTGEI